MSGGVAGALTVLIVSGAVSVHRGMGTVPVAAKKLADGGWLVKFNGSGVSRVEEVRKATQEDLQRTSCGAKPATGADATIVAKECGSARFFHVRLAKGHDASLLSV